MEQREGTYSACVFRPVMDQHEFTDLFIQGFVQTVPEQKH